MSEEPAAEQGKSSEPGMGIERRGISRSPITKGPVNDIRLERNSVVFTWEEVPESNAYWIQVSKDENFEGILQEAYVGPSSSAVLPIIYPEAETRLFWRIRSRGADTWSDYSKVSSFIVAGRTVEQQQVINPIKRNPLIPQIIAPSNGAPVEGEAATFSWHSVPRAVRYNLQVAVDENFSRTLFDSSIQKTDTFTVLDVFAEDESLLYWRIRAGDKYDWWDWSESAEFRTSTSKEVEEWLEVQDKEKHEVSSREPIGNVSDFIDEENTSLSQAGITIGIMLVSFIITLGVIIGIALNMN